MLKVFNFVIHSHEELCPTLLLNLPPYSVGLFHHGVIVGLGVGATDDTRTAMGTTTAVQS